MEKRSDNIKVERKSILTGTQVLPITQIIATGEKNKQSLMIRAHRTLEEAFTMTRSKVKLI